MDKRTPETHHPYDWHTATGAEEPAVIISDGDVEIARIPTPPVQGLWPRVEEAVVAVVERLNKLAAPAATDSSLEARAGAAFDAWEHGNRAAFPYEPITVDRNAPTTRKIWQAVVRAVDASRPPVGEAPAEPERTPETVLRAMLRAYEAAALEAEVAYMRTCPDASAAVASSERAEHLGFWCERLRRETASIIAWGGTPHLMSEIAADYETRLAGTRPLNATPLEV